LFCNDRFINDTQFVFTNLTLFSLRLTIELKLKVHNYGEREDSDKEN
jgi:hypothetical protein